MLAAAYCAPDKVQGVDCVNNMGTFEATKSGRVIGRVFYGDSRNYSRHTRPRKNNKRATTSLVNSQSLNIVWHRKY